MLKFLKIVHAKIILALGALLTGLDELFEALFTNFQGFLEVHHGIILLSAIHIYSAFESFFDAHDHTSAVKDHLRRGDDEN
ncbi:hypothetical protein MWN63_15625 [Paradonghicola geojensis]|nr:hypothetical protein [Marivivens geojensis]